MIFFYFILCFPSKSIFFLPHLCDCHSLPGGIVLFGLSDPEIFGYEQNASVLLDRKYLRQGQAEKWIDVKANQCAWLPPEEIARIIISKVSC